jgi:methylenetetrahydrofolate dehydrogenase (NADP+)/methenyltetrahydrofolate cyclohydrolase
MRMLAVSNIATAGKHAVVIGRSDIVGKPMAALLGQKGTDATVTLCHSRTRDISACCRDADILVAALGMPRFVQGDWIKPGAVVIDVGINRVGDSWSATSTTCRRRRSLPPSRRCRAVSAR